MHCGLSCKKIWKRKSVLGNFSLVQVKRNGENIDSSRSWNYIPFSSSKTIASKILPARCPENPSLIDDLKQFCLWNIPKGNWHKMCHGLFASDASIVENCGKKTSLHKASDPFHQGIVRERIGPSALSFFFFFFSWFDSLFTRLGWSVFRVLWFLVVKGWIYSNKFTFVSIQAVCDISVWQNKHCKLFLFSFSWWTLKFAGIASVHGSFSWACLTATAATKAAPLPLPSSAKISLLWRKKFWSGDLHCTMVQEICWLLSCVVVTLVPGASSLIFLVIMLCNRGWYLYRDPSMAMVHSGLFMWFRRLAKPTEKVQICVSRTLLSIVRGDWGTHCDSSVEWTPLIN